MLMDKDEDGLVDRCECLRLSCGDSKGCVYRGVSRTRSGLFISGCAAAGEAWTCLRGEVDPWNRPGRACLSFSSLLTFLNTFHSRNLLSYMRLLVSDKVRLAKGISMSVMLVVRGWSDVTR